MFETVLFSMEEHVAGKRGKSKDKTGARYDLGWI